MEKTILITGATDGIGLETARVLASGDHHILLHGRNPARLKATHEALSTLTPDTTIDIVEADLSRLDAVEEMAAYITRHYDRLDVLINNAGVYRSTPVRTVDGLDIRFAVNTIAPYLLTNRLLPLLGPTARVLNVSSAAQSPVHLEALSGAIELSDGHAYAQSKLALTMWSVQMGRTVAESGPMVLAINPGSMLGSKMVKEAFGVDGADIGIGADILCRGALSDEFAHATGQYYDNDRGTFASPHPDALDETKSKRLTQRIEEIVTRKPGALRR